MSSILKGLGGDFFFLLVVLAGVLVVFTEVCLEEAVETLSYIKINSSVGKSYQVPSCVPR